MARISVSRGSSQDEIDECYLFPLVLYFPKEVMLED